MARRTMRVGIVGAGVMAEAIIAGLVADRAVTPDLLVASGFEVTRVHSRFLPFSMKGRMPVHPLLVRLYLRSPWRPCAGQMLVVAQKPRI